MKKCINNYCRVSKKFIAHLKGKQTRYQKPLSAKRIQNIMIPLRMIGTDFVKHPTEPYS